MQPLREGTPIECRYGKTYGKTWTCQETTATASALSKYLELAGSLPTYLQYSSWSALRCRAGPSCALISLLVKEIQSNCTCIASFAVAEDLFAPTVPTYQVSSAVTWRARIAAQRRFGATGPDRSAYTVTSAHYAVCTSTNARSVAGLASQRSKPAFVNLRALSSSRRPGSRQDARTRMTSTLPLLMSSGVAMTWLAIRTCNLLATTWDKRRFNQKPHPARLYGSGRLMATSTPARHPESRFYLHKV
jgi:hypothetical protein